MVSIVRYDRLEDLLKKRESEALVGLELLDVLLRLSLLIVISGRACGT